ncbi:MAG: response regulator transcription factor [Ferruginibacter sp.]
MATTKRSGISLALVDDHKLFRKGLRSLIEMVDENIAILFEADSGMDMQQKLGELQDHPDIILLDINMPVMNGFECVQWLNRHHPDIKVLVISMVDSEDSVLKMLKLKVKGFLSKDVEPEELGEALHAIASKGFYYTDFITGRLVHNLQFNHDMEHVLMLSEKERKFIQLACSDLTYNDIAKEMFLSPKTIDSYRLQLFERLNVKSRVGLALYAVKHGIVVL